MVRAYAGCIAAVRGRPRSGAARPGGAQLLEHGGLEQLASPERGHRLGRGGIELVALCGRESAEEVPRLGSCRLDRRSELGLEVGPARPLRLTLDPTRRRVGARLARRRYEQRSCRRRRRAPRGRQAIRMPGVTLTGGSPEDEPGDRERHDRREQHEVAGRRDVVPARRARTAPIAWATAAATTSPVLTATTTGVGRAVPAARRLGRRGAAVPPPARGGTRSCPSPRPVVAPGCRRHVPDDEPAPVAARSPCDRNGGRGRRSAGRSRRRCEAAPRLRAPGSRRAGGSTGVSGIVRARRMPRPRHRSSTRSCSLDADAPHELVEERCHEPRVARAVGRAVDGDGDPAASKT